MSIQVNNISVSINGTQSEQFHIELDGSKFTFGSFSLQQSLLQPCRLTFTLQKDRQEEVSDVQFNVCGSIIGTPVTLTLQTGNTEKEITNFQEGSQNANIEFEGFITNAQGFREATEYYIKVTAVSNDAKMITRPNCYMFNDYKLADIVSEVVKEENELELEGTPAYETKIHYTVQYDEGDYQFLQRLAVRFGEWMFSTGKKIHFGKLEDQEEIQLKCPSQDMSEYNVKLQTCHVNYGYGNLLYNHRQNYSLGVGTHQDDTGSALNDSTWAKSKERYSRATTCIAPGASLESDDEATGFQPQEDEEIKLHVEPTFAEQRRIRSNMVVYSGTTFCSRMKIGAKLTIKDDYISGESSQKSEVQQDQILITSVTHNFNVNGEYDNTFQGIPAAITYPPYTNTHIFPNCDHPVRAVVVDTEDPKHWGRVKVRFPWQRREYDGRHGDKEKNGMTPWIQVMQPYNGANEEEGGYYGVHLIPEIFTTVLVDFEEGNFERPYVSCCFFDHEHHVDDKWYPGNNNVKAIRTASGHTIEIHDTQTEDEAGEKGFIRIYDNKLNIYDVLLSADKKLIKMNCKGDIDIHADGNISMSAGGNINASAGENINTDAGGSIRNKAGEHVSNSAGGDFNAGAGGTFNGSAGGEVIINAGSNFSAKATAKMDLTSEDEMKIHSSASLGMDTSDEMCISAEKDMSILAHKGLIVTVEEDANVTMTSNLNLTVMKSMDTKVSFDYNVKATNITENGDMAFKQYSTNYEVNATGKAAISAVAAISIVAPIIKEN